MRRSDIIIGGAALVLFLAAFFAVPLCVALALCATPCCSSSDEASIAGATPCAVECAVRADAAQAPDVAVTKIATPPALTPEAFDEAAVIVRSETKRPEPALPAGVPLHLLHATFLI